MLEDYLNNRPKPQQVDKTPRGWDAHIEVGSDGLEIVTKATPVGEENFSEATPDDCRRILKENNLNPDAWTLVSYRRSHWQQSPEVWLEATKLSAKPSDRKFGVTMPTLDSVVSSMDRAIPVRLTETYIPNKTVVANIADPQIGKVDMLGGTKEFLIRNRDSMARWAEYVRKVQPEEIICADLGDAFEGIENTAQQPFTNDLSVIDQMDLWGQIHFEWIELASQLAPKVASVSVGSNHTALRRGKDYIGRPCDDYGLLVHRFIARQAKMRPDLYGHVSFFAPGDYEESLTYQTLSGVGVGFVHGHQFRQVHIADDWWADQTHGECPLASAKILNFGHHHHVTIKEGRGGKFLFGSSTNDGGSAWIRNLKGSASKAGVMTYTVDANGPYNWQVC